MNLYNTPRPYSKNQTFPSLSNEIFHISPPVLSSAGLTDEAVHLAYVKVEGEPNKDKLEASEDIETSLLTQSAVELLMKSSVYPIGKLAYAVMKNFVRYGEI